MWQRTIIDKEKCESPEEEFKDEFDQSGKCDRRAKN